MSFRDVVVGMGIGTFLCVFLNPFFVFIAFVVGLTLAWLYTTYVWTGDDD